MSVSFTRKVCATCAYWGGARSCDELGTTAYCGKDSDLGVCSNMKSGFKGKKTKASASPCLKYAKWTALGKMK